MAMKNLLFVLLMLASTAASAASFTADILWRGATMKAAYVKVTGVSGDYIGWHCNFSVWPSQLSSLTDAPTQAFTYPSTVNYVSDSDTPLKMCASAIQTMPIFSNVIQ